MRALWTDATALNGFPRGLKFDTSPSPILMLIEANLFNCRLESVWPSSENSQHQHVPHLLRTESLEWSQYSQTCPAISAQDFSKFEGEALVMMKLKSIVEELKLPEILSILCRLVFGPLDCDDLRGDFLSRCDWSRPKTGGMSRPDVDVDVARRIWAAMRG